MRPKLLDLFCCGGGAAMGYSRAGFDVVGVDIKPQPRYPFSFVQGDALEYLAAHGSEFDAVHASPPCPRYSAITPKANRENHPDLVGPTRDALRSSGKPYIMENVPGAPMVDYFVLCGTMFGLQTPCGAKLWRHRLFETNFDVGLIPPCDHSGAADGISEGSPVGSKLRAISVTGNAMGVVDRPRHRAVSVTGHSPTAGRSRTITVTGNTAQQNVVRNQVRQVYGVKDAQAAMGIDWLPMKQLSQAIPPAYKEFIGRALIAQLEVALA